LGRKNGEREIPGQRKKEGRQHTYLEFFPMTLELPEGRGGWSRKKPRAKGEGNFWRVVPYLGGRVIWKKIQIRKKDERGCLGEIRSRPSGKLRQQGGRKIIRVPSEEKELPRREGSDQKLL